MADFKPIVTGFRQNVLDIDGKIITRAAQIRKLNHDDGRIEYQSGIFKRDFDINLRRYIAQPVLWRNIDQEYYNKLAEDYAREETERSGSKEMF